MKFKSLPNRFLAMIISMLPLAAWPQTSAIAWSSFGGGFSVSSSATTQLISLTCIPFISSAAGPSTVIKSGFLSGLPVPSGVTAIGVMIGVPTKFALHQNYPNPFNPSTRIEFDLPHQINVSLKVYDIVGRELTTMLNESMNPGYHRVHWNGRNKRGQQVPSGIYIVRLVTSEYSKSIKLVLMK